MIVQMRIGKPKIGTQQRSGELRYQFLECIGLVAEALSE